MIRSGSDFETFLAARTASMISALREASGFSTTLAFAWKDRAGDGQFQLVRGADRLLNAADIEAARIPEMAAIVVGSVALSEQPSRRAIELCR